MNKLPILAAILLLSSCNTAKHVTREKTDITTDETTVIDTSVVVSLKPIEFSSNLGSLPTLGQLSTTKQDTIKSDNGDLLIIDRKGDNISFRVQPKPQKVDVKAKKTKKTHEKSTKKDKVVEKNISLWSILGIAAILLVAFWLWFRKLV